MRNLLSRILAHDLRSPLSAITNSVELLRRVPALPTAGVKAAENAHRSAMRMKRMIDDLLDVTRTSLGGDVADIGVFAGFSAAVSQRPERSARVAPRRPD
ncbi:histidine kinase dimerization/phospho-acceptor domain-containing protein [Caballeronia pedi]|uniref:histidine kinase dimerization/phospho-acceptor domain-containing protein n=1 Tax=Caballeronia pedi TaxID=1777141 RepID=UPI003CC63853